MSQALIVAILTGLGGSLGAYLAAVRRLSGKISHSTSAELWAESKSIRDDYRSRISELNEIVIRMEGRIAQLEKRNESLYLENGHLQRMAEQHEETISELRVQIHRLSDENVVLKRENTKLKKSVATLEENGG